MHVINESYKTYVITTMLFNPFMDGGISFSTN